MAFSEDTMTRAEHLAWAKQRALEYLPDDLNGAYSSFISDMGKHSQLRDHSAIKLGHQLLFGGFLGTTAEMRNWIEGFN